MTAGPGTPAGPGTTGAGAPGVLRVLTWNVHGLRAGTDAVAEVLRAAACDAVGVVRVTQAALPLLRRSDAPHVVTVS
ncbi:hypothetical protein HLB09_10830, partial [Pseudokineococcus marinus]